MIIFETIPPSLQELYLEAFSRWGLNLQVIQLIEELSELTQSLAKYLLNRPNWDNICEEFADVEIMTEQVRLSLSKENLIMNWKTRKIERLESIINKES